MKYGQKPAEPRMEDVLASIRRAIDETAIGPDQDRLGGSMAEFRVKFDTPANQETRSRRAPEHPVAAAASAPQGFAGILSGKKSYGEVVPPRETFRSREPAQLRPEPITPHNREGGQILYDGYYGAQVEDYVEPAVEYSQTSMTASPGHYLPLPSPATGAHRQNSPAKGGLMSESSSEATQAA